MDKRKPKRDYRVLWLISFLVLLVGVFLTFTPAMIRPLGYTLLILGGVGIVWSLVRMDRGKEEERDRDEPWRLH